VQNILAFRFGNSLSHSGTVTSLILYRLLLQKKLVLKTVVGFMKGQALRDMIQNHLQILTMVAMEADIITSR
jgi:glucose-6-phosphate 1-dehydrogenase